MGDPGHRDRYLPTPFVLVVRQYPADEQGAHRRPVRSPSGGADRLVAAAEPLDRCPSGRAETSDGRLLLGQLRKESGRITIAVPVSQVMGDQQSQGGVVGGRAAWPFLVGQVEDVLRIQHAQQAVPHDLYRRTGQRSLLYCQAFLPRCARGSAQRDPRVGDVVTAPR